MEEDKIRQIVKESYSMRDAAAKLGLTRFKFEKLARKYGIWKPNKGAKGRPKGRKEGNGKMYLSDILNGLHPKFKTYNLKKRLIAEGLKTNKCEGLSDVGCSVGEVWNGRPLVCHLDHINGDPTDHRLENLRMLCPNCHSQTETYSGKNKNKK